ncbi:MAG: toll/interleukin-1 receptor domain-containing protein, partial [Myxococcales bacterium]|nr:toll/interleukin-1 receptor domain-containing protein [Myxococcales bacterium]
MSAEFEFDVFLAHASADKSEVEALAVRLRDEHGLRVWFDRWCLLPGDDLLGGLTAGLAGSRCIAVMLGPGGIGPWQGEEMRVALNQSVYAGKRVIPVLFGGAEP